MNVTLVNGLSGTLSGQWCFYIYFVDDNILENNEYFVILLSPTMEDRNVVVVPMAYSSEEVAILEDINDGMHKYV